jgi:hypothetical protein
MFGSKSKPKYKDAKVSDQQVAEIGFSPGSWGFESFEEKPEWGWEKRVRPRVVTGWPTIVPRAAPPLGKKLPLLIERMMESTWQFAEPADMQARSSTLVIGARGKSKAELLQRITYSPQVRPTRNGDSPGGGLTVQTPSKSAIASDWKVFEQIDRTHAVTFRGDTRCPWDVIVKCDGFHPPSSRTDQAYLENVYVEFASYLDRRYGRPLTKDAFMKAVNKEAAMPREQRTLVDYMMWRKIVERDAVHLGRMVENECLKGYISSSRSIDVAMDFASKSLTQPGWLYVTIVHDGFVVPHGLTENWGTNEAEVAQWGPIPSQRVVGFRRVTSNGSPVGPIFMKRRFRMEDPKAFDEVFDVMSGKKP